MQVAKSDTKRGRKKGSKDSKPRKKNMTAKQRSEAAKKAAATRARKRAEKADQVNQDKPNVKDPIIDDPKGLNTGDKSKPKNEQFEQILESGGSGGSSGSEKTKLSSAPDEQSSGSPLNEGQPPGDGSLDPSDVSEWIGWPFNYWAFVNGLPDIQLSEQEKQSLAEPLCKIANRHNIDRVVNPDILDGITAAGRLAPIMVKRFAMVSAERKRRAANGVAETNQAKPDEGASGDVTT